jgi:hypothetical protein
MGKLPTGMEEQVKSWVYEGRKSSQIQDLSKSRFGRGVPSPVLRSIRITYNEERHARASELLSEGHSIYAAGKMVREEFGRGLGAERLGRMAQEFYPDPDQVEKVTLPPEVFETVPKEAVYGDDNPKSAFPKASALVLLSWMREAGVRSVTVTDTGKVLQRSQIDLEPGQEKPSILDALRTLL